MTLQPTAGRVVEDGLWLLQQLGYGVIAVCGLLAIVFLAHAVDRLMATWRRSRGDDE